jgi:hypothetical protein
MEKPSEAARYVPVAAAALGLPLAAEDLDDVIAAFTILERVANVVMSFPLPEEVIPAAVFCPDKESAP